MNVNIVELSELIQELKDLTNKRDLTSAEKRRETFLLSAISAVKAGATLGEVEHDADNERRRKAGLMPRALRADRESELRGWKHFLVYGDRRIFSDEQRESRDMAEGNPVSRLGTYTSLGYFVPTNFFPQLFSAMAAHDVLFDDTACTVIRSTSGEPLTIPTSGDIENVATVIGEGSQVSVNDLAATGHASLGNFKYAAYDRVSLESFQDMEGALSAVNVFKRNFADRFARGIGKDLVTGSGSGKTLGLIPSLLAAGVPTVAAAGSSANDGSTNTGANSLGSTDFMNALSDLDDAYANSPRCAWLMNKKTLANVSGIVTKYGQPLDLVKWIDGQPTIYGIPVRICPSMDNIGNGKNPVVLGDLSYWATRLIADKSSGFQVIKEAPNTIEYGNVGLISFVRADGHLLWSDTGSPAPFVVIQTHS